MVQLASRQLRMVQVAGKLDFERLCSMGLVNSGGGRPRSIPPVQDRSRCVRLAANAVCRHPQDSSWLRMGERGLAMADPFALTKTSGLGVDMLTGHRAMTITTK